MLKLILIPIFVALFAQALKLITDGVTGNFDLKHMMSDYGGMPSGHTAFVAALATVVGLDQGLNSAAFAITIALFIIVVRDAVGFRREIGRNAVLTNVIGKEVFKKWPKNKQAKVEYLNEKMGHTVREVLGGFVLGVMLSVTIYILLLAI